MNEFAINGGDGLKKPHPALLDIEVRRAIAHAIDKETIVDRVLAGLGKPQDTLSVSPNPIWSPEIPADKRFDFDLAESRRILDDGRLQRHQRRRRPRDAGRRPAAALPLRRPLRGRHGRPDGGVHLRLDAGDRHRHHARRSTTTAASPR